MSAYYDAYDYSSYWRGREYEHSSEVICLKEFLSRIPKIDRSIEIGGGYGRLVPHYIYRIKNCFLTDPSKKELSQAKERLANFKNIKYIQSTLENLPSKVKPRSFDLLIMVRVMHHLTNPDKAFETIEKLAKPGGYLILEFANKIHFKKILSEFFKGNFDFLTEKKEIDVRSEKSKKSKTIAFLNYHPDIIKEELASHNFEILEIRSVSNIRSPFLKKHMPLAFLLFVEGLLQKPLSYFYFGPSIFVLAKKMG